MFGVGKLKRKIIKGIILLLLPFLLISIAVGIIVLLAGIEIVPSTPINKKVTSENIDVNININVEELIAKGDSYIWNGLTGGLLSAVPEDPEPENADEITEAVEKQITSIDIPIRKWKSEGSMERIETTATIEVNKLLAQMWQDFFTEVYRTDPGFVISEIGGYRVDSNNGDSNIGYQSAHTYGAAVDINPSVNEWGKGVVPEKTWNLMSESHQKYETIYENSPIVKIAHAYTLKWGGEFSSTKDTMHFSFVADGSTREERLQEYREDEE